jgi:hypothetical protein
MLVTADGRVLAAADDMVWSVLDTGAVPRRAWPPPAGDGAWTPDGALFAQPLADATLVAWWDVRGRQPGGVLAAPATVSQVSASADGRRLAAATDDSVELFDTATRRATAAVTCGKRVALTPTGGVLACVKDGAVRIAGADDATLATVREPFRAPPALLWRGDGTLLAIGTETALALVDAAGETVARVTLPWTGKGSPRVAFSPDGGQLLVAAGRRAVVVTLADARGDVATDVQIVRGLRKAPRPPAAGEPAVLADGVVEGRVTVGGRPARDANVRLAPCSPGVSPPVPVRTGPDGQFQFTRLPRGCWDVAATQDTAIAGGGRVTLSGLSGRERADLALLPAGTLTGVVKARGRPAAGAVVTVDGAALTATTGDDGRFALTPLPPGAVTVRACGADACSAPTPGDPAGKPLKLELDQPPLVVPPPPPPPAAPAGLKVLLPRMGDGDLVALSPGACERTPEGCVARGLAPGRYRVAVHARDHRLGAVEIELRPGEDAVVPAPLDGPAGEIVGRVVDAASGQPLAGVVLTTTCSPDGGAWTFRTGPDGRFRLHGLAPGQGHPVRLAGAPAFGAHEIAPAVIAGQVTDVGDVPLRQRE